MLRRISLPRTATFVRYRCSRLRRLSSSTSNPAAAAPSSAESNEKVVNLFFAHHFEDSDQTSTATPSCYDAKTRRVISMVVSELQESRWSVQYLQGITADNLRQLEKKDTSIIVFSNKSTRAAKEELNSMFPNNSFFKRLAISSDRFIGLVIDPQLKNTIKSDIPVKISADRLVNLSALLDDNIFNDPKKQKAYIKSLHRALELSSQIAVKRYYHNGQRKYVTGDYKQAFLWFLKAAQRGHSDAQFRVGYCYYSGKGVYRDFQSAVSYYLMSAAQKNSSAECCLGVCYERGEGVPQDIAEAVRLYSLSAKEGNDQGQYNLGSCYEHGIGVEKNTDEAIRLYKLSAAQGNPHAQYNLGISYFKGETVAKNKREAIRLIKLAAASNAGRNNRSVVETASKTLVAPADSSAPPSGNSSASSSDISTGTPMGLTNSQSYGLRKTAASAQYFLAVCYSQGDEEGEIPMCLKTAVKLLKMAADQDHPLAQYNLGVFYQFGIGVESDMTEAIGYYTLSANQGDLYAMYNLAVCYFNGTGVNQDIDLAIELYTQAANRGDPCAQFNLAMCYECGDGVETDLERAEELYELAVSQGHEEAADALKKLRERKNSSQ